MSDFEFWTQIYRALMMAAKAILKYKLAKSPNGQRVITDDSGVIVGYGYDPIDTSG